MSKKYQQGDVLLMAVPKDKKSELISDCQIKEGGNEENKVVLALGEATGHHHRFEIDQLEPDVTVTAFHGRSIFMRSDDQISTFPEFVHIEGGSATLYHEEHNPLTLPPGLYRRSIVREFNHLGNSTREVVD